MSTPNPDDGARFDNNEDDAPSSPRSTIAGILWTLLLVALIAGGIWWYIQQAEVQVPPTPPAIEAPLVVYPQSTEPASDASASPPLAAPDLTPDLPAVPPKPAPPPKPKVAGNRDPLPLPGNRTPVYPGQALRSGVEGSVSVLIDVDASGVPSGVRVVRRTGERSRDLDRAVLTAARNWRFDPAIRNGQPVPGQVVLPVQFKRD